MCINCVLRLSRKVVESAGIHNNDNNSENSKTVAHDDDDDQRYFYPSREIVDRFFADVQEYHNQHEDDDQSFKDRFKDAFHTIIYPLTGLLFIVKT